MKLIKFSCLLLLIIFSANSLSTELDELNTLLNNYVKAVNDLDLDLAEKIWSHKESISFIHPGGHQRGWEEIRDAFYLGAMANFQSRELKLKDVNIRILSDNTAWADFYWDFDAKFIDGSPMQTSGRETQIWKKESGGWKIVHVHYSGLPVTGEREGF